MIGIDSRSTLGRKLKDKNVIASFTATFISFTKNLNFLTAILAFFPKKKQETDFFHLMYSIQAIPVSFFVKLVVLCR